MKWSWKIGQLAGIDLRIHATFLLLLGWLLLSYWMSGQSVAAMVAGIIFIVALFACVVLHEMGHALAARKFGIRTRDITLLPIGGVARLERLPRDPSQELCVALAGPLVNVAIAAVLYVWLTLTHAWEPFSGLGVVTGAFPERLLMANIWLVLFNLVPAFPMDGGRVLRALLASRMTYSRATEIAASVGQALAFIFGFVGLFTNPMLVFVSLFVWIGASQELYATQMKSALSGTPAHTAMLTDFETLESADSLAEAVRKMLRGSPHDFPVLDHPHVIGILTRTDLLIALTEFGPDYPVASVMRRQFLIAEPAEMLDKIFQRLQEYDCHTMPVVHDGRMVGLITTDNLGEYLLIEAALQRRGESVNRRNPLAALLSVIRAREPFSPRAPSKVRNQLLPETKQ